MNLRVRLGDDGLSPPTRGSPARKWRGSPYWRSVPAHTGKPRGATRRSPCRTVYPRPHGEACSCWPRRTNTSGLSPPTRGSHLLVGRARGRKGSIPAHTGKPGQAGPRWWPSRVYPRPHGEAWSGAPASASARGLSPPTRGSLPRRCRRSAGRGSIPAHTGKPTPRRRAQRPGAVYPRPHGEAEGQWAGAAGLIGLSPPTRGSRCSRKAISWRVRSIPAHTGKPIERRLRPGLRRVYPRPHGEALPARRP